MRKILTLLFMVAAWLSFAQTGNVGVNTTTPDAVLEVYSTTKGVLVPRLTTTQRDAMVSPQDPTQKVQEGTIIYNLDLHCLQYNIAPASGGINATPVWIGYGCGGAVATPFSLSNPPVLAAVTGVAKSGSAATDLAPTGGTSPYTYTAVTGTDPGGTLGQLPSGSNLVVNPTTGAYTFTVPAGTTPGAYYFGVKVCDATTPTAQCLTKTYTVNVTAAAVPCTTPTFTVANCGTTTNITTGSSATVSVTAPTNATTTTWQVKNAAGTVVYSGTGITTGSQTYSTADTYTVIFTATNSTTPAGCSTPATATCSSTVTVTAGTGSVTAFDCSTAKPSPINYNPNGAVYTGTAALSYTGGNGGSYAAGSVASTGITGFTATWSAGTLATGAGNITISITGSSTTAGIASFPITIAGNSCTIKLYGCGAPTNTGGFLPFMCHNLGADETVDPFTPSWQLNGAYIQWGKRGPTTSWQTTASNGSLGFAAAPTGSTAGTANDGAVASWSTSAAANGAWNVTEGSPVKTANDPCPSGYRVPTRNEWVSIYSTTPMNTQTNWSNVGTWTSSSTNYTSGKNVNNSLFLPTSGYRSNSSNGTLLSRGVSGHYWSSTLNGTNAYILYVGSGLVLPASYDDRLKGFSVRCVAE